MFMKIEPLEFEKHQNLRLGVVPGFKFADKISTVKLCFSEFRQASRFYPIIFFKDLPGVPQALLSLKKGLNDCIDQTGKWKMPYIPLFFRLYPFTLAKIEEQGNQFALCLDPEAEHFKSGMGEPLFSADGKLSEFIEKNILKNLENYQKELEATQTLFKALDDKNLLINKAFTYTLAKEQKRVDGFRGIDMEKVKELNDHDLAEMVRNGSLGLIHEHISSFASFKNLLAASAPPIPGLSPA